jgi:hypothetical protein
MANIKVVGGFGALDVGDIVADELEAENLSAAAHFRLDIANAEADVVDNMGTFFFL